MAKSNPRIIKKLSKKAAELMPSIRWDTDEDEPYCEWWDSLLKGTPILWYRCSYEYDEYESRCAWAALKIAFMNDRDSTIYGDGKEWFWGMKPTPANVLFWGFLNPAKLDHLTERSFGY